MEYEAFDGDAVVGRRGVARSEVAVELTPPLNSIVRGGILGAALLALFVSMYRGSRMHSPPPEDNAGWAERADKWVRTWTWEALGGIRILIVGSIVATITILLLQRLSDVGLPITLDVKDWIGGLVTAS
ncbi:MAG TPA: hypothetical protein VI485_08050 [Vicinamibacterales bacterium]|nr:hypothetical protein [Vicinamibacterales bacterium]